MDTSLNPAVNVGPTRAHPALALLLALLSIPGTTWAWDLDIPVPGFLIGGPLGLAAIVLAVHARRDQSGTVSRPTATAASVIAALALGQMVIWTAVSLVS